MLEERYRRAFDAVSPTKELLNQTIREAEEMNAKKSAKRMGSIVLALVLTLAALTGVGFATGAIQTVFGNRIGRYLNDQSTDYEELDRLAASDIAVKQATFADGATVTVNCAQSYYDGEQLFAAFTWKIDGYKANLDFGPDSEGFENLKPTATEKYVVMIDSSEYLSADELSAFRARLAEEGSAGIAYTQYYLGDGVLAGDGYISPEADDSGVYEDGTHWRYIEFETPLPEEYTNLDSIPITVRLYAQKMLYYADASGEYYFSDVQNRETAEIDARIPRSEAETVTYTAETAQEKYASSMKLIVSPVNARLTITTDACEEWLKADEEWDDSVDYVMIWNIYADGEEIGSNWIREGGVAGVSGSFVIPEGAKQIALRPVYNVSGENAGEEVVIDLALGE